MIIEERKPIFNQEFSKELTVSVPPVRFIQACKPEFGLTVEES